jgi:dTDP-glucose pyrophosphorylase
MVKIGVEKIVIPTYTKKERVLEYFEHAKNEIDAEICLLSLNELPKGIALSIQSARPNVDEPFIVILGDDITIADSFQPLLDAFFTSGAVAVEAVVKEENQKTIKKTCCVELKDSGQITEITEKPRSPKSNIRGCGIYVFDPQIFEYIESTPPSPPRNEVEITNTIGLVAKDGKAYGKLLNGININVNSPDDLFQAWCVVKQQQVKKR